MHIQLINSLVMQLKIIIIDNIRKGVIVNTTYYECRNLDILNLALYI